MQIHGEREIDDLTRDHDRDQRILAEAAVRLSLDAWPLSYLFRSRTWRSKRELDQ